ncbi:MAG: hypothetical protein ACRDWE_00320 [Acidimicrobiales bacterium]
MSSSEYLVDVLLVALVLRQVRPRPITARSVLLPAVLLAFAGAEYLRSFPTAGNDLALVVVLVVLGALLGLVSGLSTKVWSTASGVMCRAGVLAATVWVLGMGFRFGFDVWAHSASGGRWLEHFSVTHSITSATAFVTAFVMMAFAQVALRVGVLQIRRLRLESAGIAQRGVPTA